MADAFERMLKDLQCEHTRQLVELNVQISILKEEIAQGRALESRLLISRPIAEAIPVDPKDILSESTVSRRCPPDIKDILSDDSKSKPSDLSQSFKKPFAMRYTLAEVRNIFIQAPRIPVSEYSGSSQHSETRPRSSFLKDMVKSSRFEVIIASIILASTLCNALAVQFDGMERGYSLGIAGYGNRGDLWGTGGAVVSALDVVFSIVFILEFLCRAIALRCGMFRSLWSWLDLIVVLSSVLDFVLGGGYGSKSSKAIRMLRIVKVARILRAIRLGGSFFNVLHVLMASVKASFSTLLWTMVMIIPVQIVCAMIMTYVLYPFFDRDDVSTSRKQTVFLYFGTFSRSLITFFEILLANYATPCRVLIDNVGEEYGAFIIAYRCICGFSVLCVVQAVFLQQSMKVVSQDSEVMLREKSLYEQKFTKNLEKLFWSLDLTGDGRLTREEFAKTIHTDNVCLYCHALGLDPQDLEDIYNLIDEGDGVVITDFMHAARHIRKQARTLDMARLLANANKIRKHLKDVPDLVVQRMRAQNILDGQHCGVRATNDAGNMTEVLLSTADISPMLDGCFIAHKQEL